MRKGFVIGADGGGTSTRVALEELDTGAVHRQAFGPMNISGSTEEQVGRTLGDMLAFAAERGGSLSHCRALCMGSAGISSDRQRAFLDVRIRAEGYPGPLRVVADYETALEGALLGEEGILLISGTGSVCHGRTAAGKTARAGGWGHLIGDEGSGYAIGRDILAAVAQAWDGCGPRHGMTALLAETWGIRTREELIAYVYGPAHTKADIAAIAPLLMEAVRQGDPVGSAIAGKAAGALAEMVVCVAGRLDMERGFVALSGSVLEHMAPVADGLKALLKERLPGFALGGAKQDAAYGALLLARKMAEGDL